MGRFESLSLPLQHKIVQQLPIEQQMALLGAGILNLSHLDLKYQDDDQAENLIMEAAYYASSKQFDEIIKFLTAKKRDRPQEPRYIITVGFVEEVVSDVLAAASQAQDDEQRQNFLMGRALEIVGAYYDYAPETDNKAICDALYPYYRRYREVKGMEYVLADVAIDQCRDEDDSDDYDSDDW